jgi:PD-(D/E)XK endonuclease
MFVYMNTLEQGDLGEVSAMEWLAGVGARILLPIGHSPDYDLVADMDGRLLRVQVKTCKYFLRGRWAVQVCTRGGNQSWSGTSKFMTADRCDYLFVLVADGRRWFIPSHALGGRNRICVGGPKYAEYEVERGRPLLSEKGSTIAV